MKRPLGDAIIDVEVTDGGIKKMDVKGTHGELKVVILTILMNMAKDGGTTLPELLSEMKTVAEQAEELIKKYGI